jgi:arginine decarboxylase
MGDAGGEKLEAALGVDNAIDQKESRLPDVQVTPPYAISRTTRHGFPAAKTESGMSRVTTLPAPITAPDPIVMPGESFGAADGPWLTYLRTLQEYGHAFPGLQKRSRAPRSGMGSTTCTA